MKIQTLFSNSDFIVVDKPANCLSVHSRLGRQETRPCLVDLISAQLKQPIYPVHRLDFEVSGIIMYALSKAAHRQANHWFAQQQVKKIYQAFTTGTFPSNIAPPQSFAWQSQIARGKKRAYLATHGKLAITHATWVGYNDQQQLIWQLHPVTGRSHQLRFELAKQQFPIVGDQLYGSPVKWSQDGIALRAVCLDFSACSGSAEYKLPSRLLHPQPLAPLADRID